MAKRAEQLNFLAPEPSQGKIIPTALHLEMQQSYLEYAMSVIVGRALPDVRDGLKPVHRRILFAMHELGLLPERPFRKCARVVGDVLGKYHPHGDQSVYDALVRLVQDFSSRYPLIAGHGNFGSVDNDPPAAMRYTECRLALIGNEALLADIDEAIIDFTDNFDGSQQEPMVLPAQLPILLLNGASGIAVGMATNIPPHNLREVVDGLIALIDQPDLPDEKLFELIPAPDFPTGGTIVDDAGVRESYTTGRGSITIRGEAAVETIAIATGKTRKSKLAIVVTELPFQVNKAAWIEKVAELVNQAKLEGISDIRDESDRAGMRVVIELKKETNSELLLEQLYRQTALQVNFGAIMLALTGALPKQMSLREILQEFINFREETLTRRYRHELSQAQQKLHLVEGLAIALANLDTLIDLLRRANDSAAAKAELQTQFELSEAQADAILSMPLRRLTGMERQNLQEEITELGRNIGHLELLLRDRRELLKTLKKELRALKKKHGDERRTRIASQSSGKDAAPVSRDWEAVRDSSAGVSPVRSADDEKPRIKAGESNGSIAPLLPPEDVVLQITHKGYIKRLEANAKRAKTADSQLDDLPVAVYATRTDRDLIVLTHEGRAFPLAISDIPANSKGSKSRGTPLIALLPNTVETIVSHFIWDKNLESEESLVLLTTQAKIKRSSLTEFAGINNRGLMAMKLKDDDRLFWSGIVGIEQQLAIATSSGRILKMLADEEQIPTMGRAAMGNQAMRLRQSETLVGSAILNLAEFPNTDLLVVTAQGFAKRIKASALRLAPRGSIGSQAITFRYKEDYLAAIAVLAAEYEYLDLLVGRTREDPQPRTVRVSLQDIPLENCNSQGLALYELGVELSTTERIANLSVR